jgi:hypothetical protein
MGLGRASGHANGGALGHEDVVSHISVRRRCCLGAAACPRHFGDDRMHLMTLLMEGGAELGDVDDDVLVRRRREDAGVLALGGHRCLVHVEHVERHLDHAEGEPKNVGKLQRKYLKRINIW